MTITAIWEETVTVCNDTLHVYRTKRTNCTLAKIQEYNQHLNIVCIFGELDSSFTIYISKMSDLTTLKRLVESLVND